MILALDFLAKIYNHIVVDKLSTIFSALSDPTRRLIVDRLARGEATVNELAQPFAVSQQAISKHLAYLERARIIQKSAEGRERICRLRPEVIREVANWTEKYRKYWEESFVSLDQVLEELKASEGVNRKKGKS
jgi:DNA-binding transcriptional ArsR family regulator